MGGVNPPSGPGASPATPAGRDPRRPWAPSPFMRLARAHAASVSGDALFAIGLAGSVFFSLDFNSARWQVALYLVLTIAPFAVAAPLIGPAIDRIKGGRRWIIVGSLAARALLCVLVVRHMESLLFYPEAFGMLVVQKVYSISKSAVVPGTVRNDEELVEANSKLTVLSALAVVVAAVPGGILLKLGGGGWSVGLGAIVFGIGTVLALQLPPTTVAAEPPGEAEKEELRSAGIVAASSAMGSIRGHRRLPLVHAGLLHQGERRPVGAGPGGRRRPDRLLLRCGRRAPGAQAGHRGAHHRRRPRDHGGRGHRHRPHRRSRPAPPCCR